MCAAWPRHTASEPGGSTSCSQRMGSPVTGWRRPASQPSAISASPAVPEPARMPSESRNKWLPRMTFRLPSSPGSNPFGSASSGHFRHSTRSHRTTSWFDFSLRTCESQRAQIAEKVVLGADQPLHIEPSTHRVGVPAAAAIPWSLVVALARAVVQLVGAQHLPAQSQELRTLLSDVCTTADPKRLRAEQTFRKVVTGLTAGARASAGGSTQTRGTRRARTLRIPAARRVGGGCARPGNRPTEAPSARRPALMRSRHL